MQKTTTLILLVLALILLGAENISANVLNQEQEREGPPPLPHGCGGFGTPISYENPVCCVSGYVYRNGVPISGAQVTVSINGESQSVATVHDEELDVSYFSIQLDKEPLAVRPGAKVTITASYNGESYSTDFVAQSGGQQIDIVLPSLTSDSSWQAVVNNSELPDPPFLKRQGYGTAYEDNGRYLVFGGSIGGAGLGSPQNETFRWRKDGWEKLTPAAQPPARTGHQLAHESQGSRVLLFGGLGKGATFLDDTWLWTGDDWALPPSSTITNAITETIPSPRAWYAMTHDEGERKWLLFGGGTATEVYSDTWVFDGEGWEPMRPESSPPARRLATLTYDPQSQRSYLFGGRTDEHVYDDLWEWDGINWSKIERAVHPLGRYGHGATYHPPTESLLISGGVSEGTLRDTWAWNGVRWTPRIAEPTLPLYRRASMHFDEQSQQVILFGEVEGGNEGAEGISVFETARPPTDSIPIATIRYTERQDIRQGSDSVRLIGYGSDGDATDHIANVRWMHNETLLSTAISITIDAATLPIGLQTIAFQVQDDEENWSIPATKSIWVRSQDSGALDILRPTWSLLVYLPADNGWGMVDDETNPKSAIIDQLQSAGAQTGVEVAILYDGPDSNDSKIYQLNQRGTWQSIPLSAIGVVGGELDTSAQETLAHFIQWGRETMPSDYSALFLAGPSNALVGFGYEADGEREPQPRVMAEPLSTLTTLSPADIRTALDLGTDGGRRKLDLLYFDGSSFGLLENAASVDGFVQYVVASPDTRLGRFDYKHYRQLAKQAENPLAYALALAHAYVEQNRMVDLPATIGVWDMTHFASLVEAVDEMGHALADYATETDSQRKLAQIWPQVQRYDSGGLVPGQLDDDDAYLDLVHLAQALVQTTTTGAILDSALIVQARAKKFIVDTDSADGSVHRNGPRQLVTYANANGLGIFYPPTGHTEATTANADYVDDKLFPITPNWGWTRFILPEDPPGLAPGDSPSQVASDLLLSPIYGLDEAGENTLYLPIVTR